MKSQTEHAAEEEQSENPRGQAFFDNITLLFILSLALSLIIYNGWGIVELLLVPAAP